MKRFTALTLTSALVVFQGYVVQGSNGEYVYLNWEERVEVVRRVKQLASPGKLIIAGSGCECEYQHKCTHTHTLANTHQHSHTHTHH